MNSIPDHPADSDPADGPGRIGDRILARGQGRPAYACRLATTPEDIEAAQRLRFAVFNLELHEGLAQSFVTGRDADPFDAVCDHLLVSELESGMVVGTYRLQTGRQAAARLGYYSAQEFDLAPYEPLRDEVVELGRACVQNEHRNLAVLGLLWRGIAAYAQERKSRYFIGCSSLTSQDPAVGARAWLDLRERHLAPAGLQTVPWPACACPLEISAAQSPKTPKLLAAYLSLGASICGPPAIDREFKTIDFLTFCDMQTLPPQTIRRYLS